MVKMKDKHLRSLCSLCVPICVLVFVLPRMNLDLFLWLCTSSLIEISLGLRDSSGVTLELPQVVKLVFHHFVLIESVSIVSTLGDTDLKKEFEAFSVDLKISNLKEKETLRCFLDQFFGNIFRVKPRPELNQQWIFSLHILRRHLGTVQRYWKDNTGTNESRSYNNKHNSIIIISFCYCNNTCRSSSQMIMAT